MSAARAATIAGMSRWSPLVRCCVCRGAGRARPPWLRPLQHAAQRAGGHARYAARGSPRQLRLQGRADAGARRAGRPWGPLRGGDHDDAADAVGAHQPLHRHLADDARRARQHRVLRPRQRADAGRDVEGAAATAPADSSAPSCSIGAGASPRASTPTSTSSTCPRTTAPSLEAIQRPGGEVVDQALAWLGAAGRVSRSSPGSTSTIPHSPYAAPAEFALALPGHARRRLRRRRSPTPTPRSGGCWRASTPPDVATTPWWSCWPITASSSASIASSRTGSSSTTPRCRCR